MGVINIDINFLPSEQSSDKENSSGNSRRNVGLPSSIANISDEVSMPGNDRCQSMNPPSDKHEAIKNNVDHLEADSGDSINRNFPDYIIDKGFKENPDHFIVEKTVDDKEEDINKHMAPQSFHSQNTGNRCLMDENDIIGTSEPPEGSQRAILKDMTNVGESSSDKVENNLNRRKGKETASLAGDNESFSKDMDDSHESVESNNSSRMFPTRKRAACFGSETNSGSIKRFKKLDNEASCSGPVLGQGSSFVNWITNVTKGFSRVVPPESSLTLVPKPPDNSGNTKFSVPPSHNKSGIAHKNTGFQSFVQALYRPGMKMLDDGLSEDRDHQQELGEYKEQHVTANSSKHFDDQTIDKKEDYMLLKPSPLAVLRLDSCQFAELPLPSVPNTPSSNSPIQWTQQFTNDHRNWGSSSSSMQNNSIPVPNKSTSSKISSSGSEYLGSLWITRLCRKPGPKIPGQHNQDVSSVAERQVDEIRKSLPLPQNEEHNCAVNSRLSSPETEVDAIRHPEQSSGPSDSCYSKGINSDQKLKCKLNPILPSQRLKKLEPMASIFAKRLDALKHIKTSGVTNDAKLLNSACFFCGRSGHNLKECQEVASFEREDLLKTVSKYEWSQRSSTICIRCFRPNHWAAACPYMSAKIKYLNSNSSQVSPMNCDNQLKLLARDISLSNSDGQMCSKKNEGHRALLDSHEIHHREVSRLGNTTSGVTGGIAYSNATMKNFPLDKVNGVQTSSFSKDFELKANQKFPLDDIMGLKVPDERTKIFPLVRELRLSRTDLISGMKSPFLSSGLDGFFLRVRLGKWEEGLSRTGYHVACISGASHEKSQGSSRNLVPVNIGGLMCFVDCCFVSNHDFAEDELNAWWLGTLKSGDKLPIEEELTKKLQERRKYSF